MSIHGITNCDPYSNDFGKVSIKCIPSLNSYKEFKELTEFVTSTKTTENYDTLKYDMQTLKNDMVELKTIINSLTSLKLSQINSDIQKMNNNIQKLKNDVTELKVSMKLQTSPPIVSGHNYTFYSESSVPSRMYK